MKYYNSSKIMAIIQKINSRITNENNRIEIMSILVVWVKHKSEESIVWKLQKIRGGLGVPGCCGGGRWRGCGGGRWRGVAGGDGGSRARPGGRRRAPAPSR